MDIHHVYPVNDLQPHTFDCGFYPFDGNPSFPIHLSQSRCLCSCNPKHRFTYDDEGYLVSITVIHNSHDGREGVEWANEILNQSK